jgi:uncharacterized delta-60 repeat protein
MNSCLSFGRFGAAFILALAAAVLDAVPVITQQPSSTVVTVGTTGSLQVAAMGTALRYSWAKDGVVIAGQTTPTLTLPTVTATDEGVYVVSVTENGTTLKSSPAVVTVVDGVAVTGGDTFDDGSLDPAWTEYSSIPVGDPTSFSESSGRMNFVAVNPTTSSSRFLVRNGFLPLDRSWTVTITLGLAGSVQFAGGDVGQPNLKVGMALGVASASDQSQSFDCGLRMVKAEGVATREVFSDHDRSGTRRDYGTEVSDTVRSVVVRLAYDPATRLLSSAYIIDGALLPVATINPCEAWGLSANDQVRLGLRGFATRVDVPTGRVWADDFLAVVRGGPTIVAAPTAKTGTLGGSATFSVSSNGDGATAFQWFRDGRKLRGATGASLALTGLKPSDVGKYHVAVTDVHGTTATAAVALTSADSAPSITTAPASVVATSGQPATFTVAASGTALRYQWRRDGVTIPGATTATWTLPSAKIADAGFYDVEVSSGLAATISAAAKLDVAPAQVASTYRLDTSFTPPVFEMEGGAVSVLARDGSGRIYAAGTFSRAAGQTRTNLARFSASMALDATYAPQVNGAINGLAVQQDGKLLISGAFTSVGGQPRFGLARLNADGSLDTGYVPPFSKDNNPNCVVLDSSGRALVGGNLQGSGLPWSRLVRLTSSGAVDPSFQPDQFTNGGIANIVIQPDGKLVTAENWFGSWSGPRNIARLNPDGTLDATFNFEGCPTSGAFYSLLLQGNKIVVAGYFSSSSDPVLRRGLFRLNSDGTLDPTFTGTLGDLGASYGFGLNVVALGDGRLAARSYVPGPSGCNVYVMSADGIADSSFVLDPFPTSTATANSILGDGTGGLIIGGTLVQGGSVTSLLRCSPVGALSLAPANWRQPATSVTAAAVADGGKWYVLGNFAYADAQPRPGIARLNADGSLDPTFAPTAIPGSTYTYCFAVSGGRVFAAVNSGSKARLVGYDSAGNIDTDVVIGSGSSVQALASAPGGKLVVAGDMTGLGGFSRPRLARFENDGRVDLGFDVGRGPNQYVKSVAVGADGHVVVGGQFSAIDGTASPVLGRLLPTGAVDSQFSSPFLSGSLYALCEGPGSALFASGYLSTPDSSISGVCRLAPTGALDPAYTFSNATANRLVALPDGRVFFGSNVYDYAQGRFRYCVGLKTDGSLDENFNVFDLRDYGDVLGLADDGRLLLYTPRAERSGVVRSGLVLFKSGLSPVAAIQTNPVSQVVTSGQNTALSVTATGDDLTYQWFKDGVAIDGATGSTLAIPSAGVPDLGSYTVTVTNSLGSVTSTAAVLSGSGTPPTITQHPGVVVATSGTSATFTVAATGSGPLSYQWRRLGCPIAGATGSTYTIPAVETANAGFYDVVVYSGLAPLNSKAGQLFVQPAVSADTYRLDPSFGPRFEMNYGRITTTAPMPDGGAYVAGDFTMIAGQRQAYLARFSSALVLDTSFTPVVDGIVHSLILQSGGKVIIGGEFQHVNGEARNGLARLNADGSLDLKFDPNANWSGTVRQMKTLPDGRIVLAGWFQTYEGGYRYAQVRRIEADGRRDSTFEFSTNGGLLALEVEPDGAILIGGYFTSVGGVSSNRIARVFTNGTVDASFAGGGGANSDVYAILRQPDGKIVLGGWFTQVAGHPSNYITRLNSDGSIDPAFSIGTGCDSGVMALVLFPSGHIGACGYFNSFDGVARSTVALLNPDGALNTAFAPIATPNNATFSLVLATDGNLLLGGYFTTVGDQPSSGLAKFAADGTLAARTAAGFRSAGAVDAVVPLPDGKWLVGGYFYLVGETARTCFARLNSDGSLDPSFDSGSSFLGNVRGLAAQGDGRILVAAWNTAQGHLWRLNADGTPDVNFSVGLGFDQPPNEMVVLPDGRIAAAGYFTTFNGEPCGPIVVLTPTGAKDPAFSAGTGFSGSVYALAVQTDCRLVVGGYAIGYNGIPTGNIVRLDTDGSLQAALGSAAGPDSSVSALSFLPNGDVVLGGNFYSIGGSAHQSRARLHADFTVDQSYATDSAISTGVAALALLPDGRAWVNAQSDRPNRARLQLLDRLTAAGSVDAGFQSFDLVKAPMAIHPVDDGRILLVGASGARGGFSRSGLLMLKPEASPLPHILVSPGNRQVVAGDSVTLAVSAAGESPLSYIWRKNGVVMPGPTSAALTIDPVELTDAASYAVEVRNAHGSAHAIGVLVVVSGPVITTQPSDTAIPLGQSTSLVVEATGTSTPSYQWYRGERGDTANPIVGAIAPTLPLNNPGAWGRYWVRVTLGGVSIDSRTALVQVAGGAVTLGDWTLLPGTPAGQRGALDMPAGDGVSNLVKFMLGVAPAASAEARLPRAVIVAGQGSDRHLALEFVYNPAATGYNLALETSADLRTWTVVPASLENVRAEGSGQRVLLRESAPLGTAARRFARLSVVPAP